MPSMLKSTVLGVALLAGTVLAAQAQSVSSLPPTGGAPMQNAATPPASPQNVGLSPGAAPAWKAEHIQSSAPYASNPAEHPYSASVDKVMAGPKPN
jgi:hypothetical protein